MRYPVDGRGAAFGDASTHRDQGEQVIQSPLNTILHCPVKRVFAPFRTGSIFEQDDRHAGHLQARRRVRGFMARAARQLA